MPGLHIFPKNKKRRRQIPIAQVWFSFEEANCELPLLRKTRRKEMRNIRRKMTKKLLRVVTWP